MPSDAGTSTGSRKRRASSRRHSQPGNRGPRGPARRRRPLLWLLLGALFLVAAPVGALLMWATRAGPGDANQRVATHWVGRESADEAARRLAELGLIDHPRWFSLYFEWFAPNVSVQAGPHLLRQGLTPRELVQRLGRLSSRPRRRVTLPEGYSYMQIAERLEGNEICSASAFRAAVRDRGLLEALGIGGDSAEGYLFPATYELFVDADPRHAVRQMVNETRKRVARMDARLGGRLAGLTAARGWTEHELLTLASIVEKEARAADERAVIASVFFNRLDDPDFRPLRMLQSDATTAYGCATVPELAPSCASYRGRVTPEMVRDARNPYNTYRISGLPKGPIGNPGEGAIEAVLSPARTNYLYFVADGTGRHRFSSSFEQHRRAITGK